MVPSLELGACSELVRISGRTFKTSRKRPAMVKNAIEWQKGRYLEKLPTVLAKNVRAEWVSVFVLRYSKTPGVRKLSRCGFRVRLLTDSNMPFVRAFAVLHLKHSAVDPQHRADSNLDGLACAGGFGSIRPPLLLLGLRPYRAGSFPSPSDLPAGPFLPPVSMSLAPWFMILADRFPLKSGGRPVPNQHLVGQSAPRIQPGHASSAKALVHSSPSAPAGLESCALFGAPQPRACFESRVAQACSKFKYPKNGYIRIPRHFPRCRAQITQN